MEDIVLLGCSGSIGLQTIDVCYKQNDFHIVGVSLNSKIDVLEEQLKYLPYLKWVAIESKDSYLAFKNKHPEYICLNSTNCSLELLKAAKYTKVVNSIVGFNGLLPSILSLQLNKILCLANKESLVIGGDLIKEELKKGHGKLYPIDSEHVALAKLLKNVNREEISKMIITASGGSLRDYPLDKFNQISVEDVLNHPTWNMGKRITIDSSTMVNKGFEFIEASYLFDFDIENIDVLINDESLVHSALLFKDHSYLFEVGPSDMRVPISYALNETRRVNMDFKEVDFNKKCSINFRKFDYDRYPLFSLVLDTFKLKGTAMAFFNGVDEQAIKYFLEKKINFVELIDFIKSTIKNDMILISDPSIENLIYVDKKAREIVDNKLKGK